MTVTALPWSSINLKETAQYIPLTDQARGPYRKLQIFCLFIDDP